MRRQIRCHHIRVSDTFTGRAVLVTGGTKGLGRGIAGAFAAGGADVLVCARNAPDGDVAGEFVAADLRDPEQATGVVDVVVERFGRIDVVVNSAGIMPMARIEVDSLDMLDKTIATNLRGAFNVMAQAAAQLGDGGRIIVLSSSVIAKSFPGYGPYIASKAAVESLVPVLANELRGRAITVNAIAPGPVGTDLFLEGKSKELVDHLAKLAPLERIGKPDEIASAVSFLAGPDGAWVNAQVVRVNGGYA